MTKKSLSRRHREFDLSSIPKSYVMPEDVPLLIRKTAEEIAGAYYHEDFEVDQLGFARRRSASFRRRWKSEKVYVRLNWASFVPIARTVLSDMLTRPETQVSLVQKEEIYNAFLEQANNRAMLDFSDALAPGIH